MDFYSLQLPTNVLDISGSSNDSSPSTPKAIDTLDSPDDIIQRVAVLHPYFLLQNHLYSATTYHLANGLKSHFVLIHM